MLEDAGTLLNVLNHMNFVVDDQETLAAYERQSFPNRVKDIEKRGEEYKLGKEFNLKFMRKGIAGDWRNHFNRKLASDTETVFGSLLRFFNYESDSSWWRDIT